MKYMRFCVIAGICLAITATASANGCKFPEMVIPEMPKIPHQRAMIIYRDGSETLIVESTYETESHNVGWVLPLPAEPSRLETAAPGMLKSLSICQQPKLTHNIIRWPLWAGVTAVLFFLPFFFIFIFFRSPKTIKQRISEMIVLLVGLLLVAFFILSAFSYAGSRDSRNKDAQELSHHIVGNYEVTILKADDSYALDAWLKSNSLKGLDADAKKIVDEYIADKWVFAVACLRRDISGTSTPHPIAATFPVKSPVYPMKLTSLAGSETYVELFVVADNTASAQGFETIASDIYNEDDGPSSKSRPAYTPYYMGDNTGLKIGSPDACGYLWEGCIVTTLTSRLTPEQMKNDVAISLKPFKPARAHYYSNKAATDITLTVGIWGALPVLIVITIACYRRRKPRKKEILAIIVLAGLIVLAASLTYTMLPKINVQKIDRNIQWLHFRNQRDILYAARCLSEDSVLHPGMTDAELAKFPEMILAGKILPESLLVNPYDGEKIRMERSPGNFWFRRAEKTLYFCAYDKSGRETCYELPAKNEPADH